MTEALSCQSFSCQLQCCPAGDGLATFPFLATGEAQSGLVHDQLEG